MIKIFAAGVGALLSLVSVVGYAGQPLQAGDLILECPVSQGRASMTKNYRMFNGDIPVQYGLSIEKISIKSGYLKPRSYAPFVGKTYYYDEFERLYKVLLVDKLGNPTYTDEYYDGVIACVNGYLPEP